MSRIISIFVLTLLFRSSELTCQIIRDDPFQNNQLPDTSYNDEDTIINKNGFFSLFKGKPGKAALFSLVIPSGGQIYNKKWWKVPIALGIDGGLTYTLVTNRKNYNLAQAEYLTALALPNQPNISTLRQKRDYYRKWSEYSWIWLIAGHLLTVVDAFVDRHLMDFDVSDDLTNINNTNNYSLPVFAKVGVRINLSTKRTQNENRLLLSKP